MFNSKGTLVSMGLLFAASMGACAGAVGSGGSSNSSGSGGFDGTYHCSGTSVTPAGTSSGTGTFSCSQGYCQDSAENPPAFTGTVNGNGSFSGGDVLCQGCDTLPMSGQFSTGQPFTISGSSGSVSFTMTCQCTGGCGGGGGVGGNSGGGDTDGGGGTGSGSPTITGFTPTSGVSGSVVTITGTGFSIPGPDGGTVTKVTATMCGMPAVVQSEESTEIVLAVPSVNTSSDSVCTITIVTPTATVTSSNSFTVHPSTTLAPGNPATMMSCLALDSTNVYFTSQEGGTVSKVAKNGGPVTVLASGLSWPWGIAVDSTDVYWVDSTGVQKVGLNGGTVTTLASSTLGSNYSDTLSSQWGSIGPYLAIDADYVYWAGGTAGNNLQKTPKGGGTTVTLEVEPSLILSIAADSTNVYWAEDNCTVNEASITGGTPTVLASTLGVPMDIAIDSMNVYWGEASMSGGWVKKVGITGGTATVVATGYMPHGLTVDSTNVYWADGTPADSGMMTWGTGTVNTAGINGGTVSVLAPGLTYPIDVAVDSTNVYWTDIAVKEMAK